MEWGRLQLSKSSKHLSMHFELFMLSRHEAHQRSFGGNKTIHNILSYETTLCQSTQHTRQMPYGSKQNWKALRSYESPLNYLTGIYNFINSSQVILLTTTTPHAASKTHLKVHKFEINFTIIGPEWRKPIKPSKIWNINICLWQTTSSGESKEEEKKNEKS